VDAVLSMPLDAFGRHHLAVRVRLPDGAECHFVSGAREVDILRKEGIPRGEIWTARELLDLLGATRDKTSIATLIAVKRTFDGTVGEPEKGPRADAV
jgi:hypothetical protein